MIHETTCDACGTKGTYDSETGEGTVRPGRADGTEMHRTYCDACAQLSDVAPDPDTAGGIVGRVRDVDHARAVCASAEARGMRASWAKDNDGAVWAYLAPADAP